MTHCYINKSRNRSRLFVRERVELLIELFGRCERTIIGNVKVHSSLTNVVECKYIFFTLSLEKTVYCLIMHKTTF